MTSSGKNWIKKTLSSKVFLFIITLALIGLAVNVGRESYRKYQLTQEIDQLKLEIERIEGKNEQLANLMEYLKEDEYIEKEARLKLNLKKPGEKVIILADRTEEEIENQEVQEDNIFINRENDGAANHWEWWQYFFAP